MARGAAWIGRVVEEEVDRGVVPPEANLTVAGDRRGRVLVAGNRVGEGDERGRGLGRRNEHVEVDIAGAARLERPVGERDRSSKGVRDPCSRQRLCSSRILSARVTVRCFWGDGRRGKRSFGDAAGQALGEVQHLRQKA